MWIRSSVFRNCHPRLLFGMVLWAWNSYLRGLGSVSHAVECLIWMDTRDTLWKELQPQSEALGWLWGSQGQAAEPSGFFLSFQCVAGRVCTFVFKALNLPDSVLDNIFTKCMIFLIISAGWPFIYGKLSRISRLTISWWHLIMLYV